MIDEYRIPDLTMEIVRQNTHGRGIYTVAIAYNERLLAGAIEACVGLAPILETAPVIGEDRSVRLVLTHHRPGIPRGDEKGAFEVGKEFSMFRVEARYPMPQPEDTVRAWKVEQLSFQGHPAALVSATWL